MANKFWTKERPSALPLHAGLLCSQVLLAIIVAVLYGVDLRSATESHANGRTPWVYAEVVAALSVLTCVGYCVLSNNPAAWLVWEFVLSILWVALSGVFGSIYIGGKNAGYAGATSSVPRMKIAVWFDLLGMILWLSSTVKSVVGCCCTTSRGTKRLQNEEVEDESDAHFVGPTAVHSIEDLIQGSVEKVDEDKRRDGFEKGTTWPNDSAGAHSGPSSSTESQMKRVDLEPPPQYSS
jgi:hypothetical protein